MTTKKSETARVREVAPTPPKAPKDAHVPTTKGRYCAQCKMVMAEPVYAPGTPDWQKRSQPGYSALDDEATWTLGAHSGEWPCIRALGVALAAARHELDELRAEFNDHRQARGSHAVYGDQ